MAVRERDPIQDLQNLIDRQWEVVQPTCFPNATGGWRLTPKAKVHSLAQALAGREAADFLRAVSTSETEPALLYLEPDNKFRSERCPPVAGGGQRGYVFFEQSGAAMGGLRLETIVQWAAMTRLREEFGWPRQHLVCESPALLEDRHQVLHQDAADILLLKHSCATLGAAMPVSELRSRVVVEVKGTAVMLEDLLGEIRRCRDDGTPHGPEHAKCKAIAVIKPELFLSIAAHETWRLFTVDDVDGRAVLGDELPDLKRLAFRQ